MNGMISERGKKCFVAVLLIVSMVAGANRNIMAQGKQKDPDLYTAKAADAHIVVEAQLTRRDDRLEIEYSASSKGDVPVLLEDALHRIDAYDMDDKYDPTLAFVTYVGESGLLLIQRITPSLPKLSQVEVFYRPWGRMLTGGKFLRGQIRVPLPAKESSPYYPEYPEDFIPADMRTTYRHAEARAVEVILEYILLKNGIRTNPVMQAPHLLDLDFRKAKLTGGPIGGSVRLLFDLKHPIPVKKRMDRFEPVGGEIRP